MKFSRILNSQVRAGSDLQGVDGCAKVGGVLTNTAICNDMLGDTTSSEASAQMMKLAKARGFSPEDTQTFWGIT